MKRPAIAFILLLLAFPMISFAQKDCGDGLPCGKLPWGLPILPVLESPTPMPTIGITAAPTATVAPTATGAPTATVAPTGTVMSDFTSLSDQISTLQAMVIATSMPVEVSGTPVDPNQQLAVSASDAGTFFGYVRAFSSLDVGGLTQIIRFTIITFAVVIAVKAITFLPPIIGTLFGIAFRTVQFFISLFKGG